MMRSAKLEISAQIVECAARLFMERGYRGTSMRDLAERLGAQKSKLFYYFDTKEALAAAVAKSLGEQLIKHMETCPTDPTSLERLSNWLLDSQPSPVSNWCAIACELGTVNPELSAMISSVMDDWCEQLAIQIEELGVPRPEAHEIACTWIVVARGSWAIQRSGGRPVLITSATRQVAELAKRYF